MAGVVVVTPNPAIDVTYRVTQQIVGDTHRVLQTAKSPGGKGVNVARALDSLGIETVSVLPIGGVSGQWMLASLRELGLLVASSPIAGETRTTVTVTDDVAHPTVFSEPGPNVSPPEWELFASELRRQLVGAAMLILSGSLPHDSSATLVADWVAEAHRAGLAAALIEGRTIGEALRWAAALGAAAVLRPVAGEVDLDAFHTFLGDTTDSNGASE